MSITPKKKTLRWNANVQSFFQIYTFLDSGFSTLIEYRNDFKFSEDFCTKSLCKLTCLKPREISIMLISLYKCPVVTSFVSFLNVIDFFFVRTKITSLCAKRLGGRTLVNLLLITLTLKSKSILITKFRL